MNFKSIFAVLPFGLLFVAGCSNDSVSSKTYQVLIQADGVAQTATISFPEYSVKAHETSGDSTCALMSGDCSGPEPVDGSIGGGDAAIVSATELAYSADVVEVTVQVQRSAADEAAYKKIFTPGSVYPVYQPTATCTVMPSVAGSSKCYDTTVMMTMTLTAQ